MDPKYYKYISKSKIEMLSDQISKPKFGLKSLTPKIKIFGVELGIDVSRESSDASLIETTVKVIKTLKKNENIASLKSGDKISTSNYYFDTNNWRDGIVSWEIDYGNEETVPSFEVYLAIREFGKDLIMLIGSPKHIIGESDIDDRKKYKRTTEDIINYQITGIMETYIRADDLNSFDDKSSINLPFVEKSPQIAAIILTGYCINQMKYLPVTNLEVVFKIFHCLKIRKTIAKLAKKYGPAIEPNIDKLSRGLEIDDLLKYKNLYIGSPLYTARI